jgi:hypothetical protein
VLRIAIGAATVVLAAVALAILFTMSCGRTSLRRR